MTTTSRAVCANRISMIREPAKEPAIDPEKIAAIDKFLEDGQRDQGYRAFVMMRQMWPQLRELALASSGQGAGCGQAVIEPWSCIDDETTLLMRARQFIADAGCDEDDNEVNLQRNQLLGEIDAALSRC